MMVGSPVNIVFRDEKTNALRLDVEALKSVLLRSDVRDKPVCVVGVVGEHKSGKSSIMNYLMRYCTSKGSEDWMGDPLAALQGFKWSNGPRRQTRGLDIWSEPFFLSGENGEQVAVFLVDTEGAFCRGRTHEESVLLVGLSLFLSSKLIYNVRETIKKDDLDNLKFFTECFKRAEMMGGVSSPFQELFFLVRDWSSTEPLLGKKTGEELLSKLQGDMRHLRVCFQDIKCYLMPHPGRNTLKKEFNGKLVELGESFLDQLELLPSQLLAPKNLLTKQVGGEVVTARYLCESFQGFFDDINNTDWMVPSNVVKSLERATVRASNEVSRRAPPGAVGTNLDLGSVLANHLANHDSDPRRTSTVQRFNFGQNCVVNFNIGGTVNQEIHKEQISVQPHIEHSIIAGRDITSTRDSHNSYSQNNARAYKTSVDTELSVVGSKCCLQ